MVIFHAMQVFLSHFVRPSWCEHFARTSFSPGSCPHEPEINTFQSPDAEPPFHPLVWVQAR